jgi:hypothetical protein
MSQRGLLGTLGLKGIAAALAVSGCVRTEGDGKPAAETKTATPAVAAGKKDAPSRGYDTCTVKGRVDQDSIFRKACSPYIHPPGGLDVINGATLTIEAGVEIRFNDGDWLEVGAAGKPGRLIAKGTADEPIILTTSSPETPDTWLGVWFHSGTLPGSELSHAVVQHAGGDNRHSKPNLLMGCVTLTGVRQGALNLHDVRAEHCTNGGFRMASSEPALSRLSVADTEEGLVVDTTAVGLFAEPAVFERVSRNTIIGGTIGTSARWVAESIPFFVSGDIHVEGASGASLSLLPGVVLEFAGERGLKVGETEPGRLDAAGSAAEPIALRARDAAVPWGGVTFGAKTSPASRIVHASVSGTGADGAVVVRTEPARVELSHVSFSGNSTDVLVGCNSNPTLADNAHASAGGVQRESGCAAAR